MSYNPLKVSLENIIPLTEARDHFSQIVNEVQKDKLYVLTKGGKPAVAIIDVKYLEHITGGEANVAEVKEEIEKAPEKVGLPPMVKHDEPSPTPVPKPFSPVPIPTVKPTPPPVPPKTTPTPSPVTQSSPTPLKPDFSAPKPYPSAPPPPKTTPTPAPTPPSPMTQPTPPSPMTSPSPTPSPTPAPTPPKPAGQSPLGGADNSSFIETTAGQSTNQADKKPISTINEENLPASSFTDKTPIPTNSNSTIDVSVMPDSDDIVKDQKAAAAAIDRSNPDDKPGPASYSGDDHEEPEDMVID